ncbi:15126_t:CDS:2 [Rhizophagus irregularis]|nr:15126_t:CDS:2 [Rhizophagus irregularis]
MCTNTILKRFLLEETDTWGKKLSQDEKDDEKWIDRCRNGYAVLVTDLKERKKKMEEARVERDTLQKKVDEAQNKEQETKSTKNIKQVSPIELHEYKSINETCSKRLDGMIDTYKKVLKEAKEAAEQRKCLRKKQGDRVMEEEGIESDSDEDEEDQMVVSTESNNKRGGKPGSRGQGRGGRRRLVKKKSETSEEDENSGEDDELSEISFKSKAKNSPAKRDKTILRHF